LPWGTTLFIWNNGIQNWDTQILDDLDENWSNPNYTLLPGSVFFIRNPTAEDLQVTISGSESSGTRSLSLYANSWNGYGPVKLPPSSPMLECVSGCEFNTGMSYPPNDGDEIWWWNPDIQDWTVETRTTGWGYRELERFV
jgi:hypothetical protein